MTLWHSPTDFKIGRRSLRSRLNQAAKTIHISGLHEQYEDDCSTRNRHDPRANASGIEAAKQTGKQTGCPSFSVDIADGYLTPNEDYEIAVEILERFENGRSIAIARLVCRSYPANSRSNHRMYELYRKQTNFKQK